MPAAEWGEKPRERVTVMPGKPDKSDTLATVRRFLPTPGSYYVGGEVCPRSFALRGFFMYIMTH